MPELGFPANVLFVSAVNPVVSTHPARRTAEIASEEMRVLCIGVYGVRAREHLQEK
jgi:hypothetical protein